jgi:hypothetical protein
MPGEETAAPPLVSIMTTPVPSAIGALCGELSVIVVTR